MSQEQIQAYSALLERCEAMIDQGQASQAITELDRWLPKISAEIGPNHELTIDATILMSLAHLSLSQLDEAEKLARRALSSVNRLEEDTIRRAIAEGTLAQILFAQEKTQEAQPLLESAISDIKIALEAGQDEAITPLEKISKLLVNTGSIDVAIDLHHLAVERFRKMIGPLNPALAYVLRGESQLLALKELYDEAARKMSDAVQICEALSEAEANVIELSWRDELASIFVAAGRSLEAEATLKKILERAQTLPASHFARLRALQSLASFYRGQKRFAEAESIYRQALQVSELAYGPEHPERVACLNNLGNIMVDMERYDEAEKLLSESTDLGIRTLGEDHPDHAIDVVNLATLRLRQGRTVEAEPLYKKGVAIWERALGPQNTEQILPRYHLAEICTNSGRLAEAEDHIKATIDATLVHCGYESPAFLEATGKLIDLRRSQGRMLDAVEIITERASILRRPERIQGAEQEEALARVRSSSPWDLAALRLATSGWVRPGILWQRRRLAKEGCGCLDSGNFEEAWLLSKRIFLERSGDVSLDEYQLLLVSGKLVGLERAIRETETLLPGNFTEAARSVINHLLEKWCLFLSDFAGCLRYAEAYRAAWPNQYANEMDNDIAYCLTVLGGSLDRAHATARALHQRVHQEGSKADQEARACVSDTLGLVLLRLNKSSEAMPLFQAAHNADPNVIHAFHLAEASFKMGDHGNTRLLLEKLLEYEAGFIEERAIQKIVREKSENPETLWS